MFGRGVASGSTFLQTPGATTGSRPARHRQAAGWQETHPGPRRKGGHGLAPAAPSSCCEAFPGCQVVPALGPDRRGRPIAEPCPSHRAAHHVPAQHRDALCGGSWEPALETPAVPKADPIQRDAAARIMPVRRGAGSTGCARSTGAGVQPPSPGAPLVWFYSTIVTDLVLAAQQPCPALSIALPDIHPPPQPPNG